MSNVVRLGPTPINTGGECWKLEVFIHSQEALDDLVLKCQELSLPAYETKLMEVSVE